VDQETQMTYDPFDPFNQLLTETPAHLLAAGHEWVKQQFYEDDTMYTDYFLKFNDEAEANAALFDEQTQVQGDVVDTVLVPKYASVDVIGVLYAPTGKTIHNEELSYAEMAPIDGWHVNVRHTEPAPELNAYKVDVKTPSRMWA
jgi:hypothetical protein